VPKPVARTSAIRKDFISKLDSYLAGYAPDKSDLPPNGVVIASRGRGTCGSAAPDLCRTAVNDVLACEAGRKKIRLLAARLTGSMNRNRRNTKLDAKKRAAVPAKLSTAIYCPTEKLSA
jgi:hypothetical protein